MVEEQFLNVVAFFFRSAGQLAYRNVQDVIDGKSLGNVPIAPEYEAGDIEHDIKLLTVCTIMFVFAMFSYGFYRVSLNTCVSADSRVDVSLFIRHVFSSLWERMGCRLIVHPMMLPRRTTLLKKLVSSFA